jgi:hypothetical protein
MLPVPDIWWLNNAFFNPSDDAVGGIYSGIKSA